MADVFSREKRSEVMSAIRSKNTSIEVTVFRFLRKNRQYFKTHYDKVTGKPDIALPRSKKAVFIDGDFWHGRDYSRRKDTLPDYWKLKIKNNINRDKISRKKLKDEGWAILRVWEHDLEKNKEFSLNKILTFLKKDN